MNWSQYPFFRLLLPFIAGLYGGQSYPLLGLCYALLGLVPLGLALLWRQRRGKSTWRQALLLALFAGLGYLYAAWPLCRLSGLGPREGVKAFYTLLEAGRPVGSSLSFQAELEAWQDERGQWQRAHGRILHQVRLSLDTLSSRLGYGDRVQLQADWQALAPPSHAWAFDYQAYLKAKGIYLQAYARHYWVEPPAWRSRAFRFFQDWRSFWADWLYQGLSSPAERDLALALILGQRQGMRREVLEAFMDTGAMHVLAVSGLHVGLLAAVFRFLLWRLPWYRRSWTWARLALLLTAVWSFALLTGASPSVLRAALMFSLLELGLQWRQPNSSYNSLAGSAFILLVYNPLYLWDLGFQLSHLAVWGILYFYQPIYRLWYIPHRLGNWLWQMTAVSLAAQLASLPLCLYHFHQFPLLFWLSGWLVLPLASVALPLGLAYLLLAPIPYLGSALAWALQQSLWLMNLSTQLLSSLPGAKLQGFFWSGAELFLAYAAFIAWLWYRQHSQARYAYSAAALILGLGLSQAWQKQAAEQQLRFFALSQMPGSAWQILQGRRALSLRDMEQTEGLKVRDALKNYNLAHFVLTQQESSWDERQSASQFYFAPPLLQIGQTRFFILDAETWQDWSRPPRQSLEVDYLLLPQALPNWDWPKLQKHLHIRQGLILDNAWRSYHWAQLEADMQASPQLRWHILRRDGALELSLN